MSKLRYRWVYSSGKGPWYYAPDYFADEENKDSLDEWMRDIEIFEGSHHAPVWSGFEYEVINEIVTTNLKFKVGDWVYVHPGPYSRSFKHYIRATITGLDGTSGYFLRAFKQDLPGVYMFNVSDEDLVIRTNKSNKLLPEA